MTVALEVEWVLRSRFGLDKPAAIQIFSLLPSTVELYFDAAAAVEWALRQYKEAATVFPDCLHAALAGEQPLWTFDKAAAEVHGGAAPRMTAMPAIMPPMSATSSSSAALFGRRWRKPSA